MKRRLMISALMVAVTTMIAPIAASASFIGFDQGGRTAWEAAVGSFTGVDLPGAANTSLGAYTEIALPYGGVFRTNESLARVDVGNGWFTWNPYIPGTELLAQFAADSNGNYVANFNFWPSGPDVPVSSSFGFEAEPNVLDPFFILLYTPQGELYQLVDGDGGAKFFGWVDEEVLGFSVISYAGSGGFAMGRFVEGTAAVPEASTLLLLGSGLVGLVAYRRTKRMA